MKNPTLAARAVIVLAALSVCGTLGYLAMRGFVLGALVDERAAVARGPLASAIEFFPDSARLSARLAEAEIMETDADLARADLHAQRAVNLSPHDFRFHLLLATIQEQRGDRQAAEGSLRAAAELAPGNNEITWRLANVLLRSGKMADCIAEFRRAASSDRELLPATLDMVWHATGGNVEAVSSLAGEEPWSVLAVARFLLSRGKAAEAASLARQLSNSRPPSNAEVSDFIARLFATGHLDLAQELKNASAGNGDEPGLLIHNGSFESDIAERPLFDWSIGRSDYARIGIDRTVARTGARSLRVEFAGLDTTRLNGEIRQMAIVHSGVRYRLECYAKTEGLIAPEGPRLVLSGKNPATWIATSEPVAPGTRDWERVLVDFTAPTSDSGGTTVVYVSFQRRPKYSYDDPTIGTIWLDDFSLSEESRVSQTSRPDNRRQLNHQ